LPSFIDFEFEWQAENLDAHLLGYSTDRARQSLAMKKLGEKYGFKVEEIKPNSI
jgi:hypothetical protein